MADTANPGEIYKWVCTSCAAQFCEHVTVAGHSPFAHSANGKCNVCRVYPSPDIEWRPVNLKKLNASLLE